MSLRTINFIIIILILKFTKIKSQKEIELNKTITGTIRNDDSYEYYSLIIPNDTESNKYNLVFVVKEDQKNIKEGEELFSDPDIYVSKKNEKPKSSKDSEYYSERYGSDILTIPSSEVNVNDTFYIGMYCQYSCKYELKAYLSEEVEIEIGKIYFIHLNKRSSLNYEIKIPEKSNFKELNIISNSNSFTEYKIFVSTQNPSSQNTLKPIPSFISGYTFLIDKNSRHYCTNCSYHILIQSEKEDVDLSLYAFFQDSITKIVAGDLVQSALKYNSKRCYSFDVGLNYKEEKIILTISLFSGYGLLYIEGWKHNDYLKYEDIQDNNNTYEILGERSILLTKTQFREFDRKDSDFEGKDSVLYFCIYSDSEMSYTLKIYYLNQAQELQDSNFIFPKNEVTGFLNSGDVTTYLLIEFSSVSKKTKSNILINFKSISGFPSFYLYFCFNDFGCYFDKQFFDEKYNSNELIPSVYSSYSNYFISLLGKDNKCYEQEKNCEMYIVVSCLSFFGICQYKINLNVEENALIMSPRTTYQSIIPNGKTDLYQININDPETESIVIVLNNQNGECSLSAFQLNLSSNEKKEELIDASFNEDYMPNVIRITPKSIKKDNLIGNYIVRVTALTFSSYNIYYYITYKEKEEEKSEEVDYEKVTMTLNEGNMILDYFPSDLNYKIYSYIPYSPIYKEDIKFTLNSQNIKFRFKVFLDLKTFKYDKNGKTNDEKIKGFDWESDSNNELIIKKNDPKFSDDIYYIVVYLQNDITDFLDNSIIKFYIGVTKKEVPFILYDGIEQFHTLSKDYTNQNFWFIHNNLSKNLEISFNVLVGKADIFIDVNLINETIIKKYENNLNLNKTKDNSKEFPSLISLIDFDYSDSIILDHNYLKKNCQKKDNKQSKIPTCPIFIYIKSSKKMLNNNLQCKFSLVVVSSENTIETLTLGIKKKGSVKNGEYKYYLIEEVRKRKGLKVSVNFEKGYGEIYMKILERKEYSKKNLYPSETDYTLKGTIAYDGKEINVPEEYFNKLNENLKINMLIAVKGENYFSLDQNNINNYTISFSYPSEVEFLVHNKPYFSYLKTGEKKYFSLYFDSSTKNIYISLSNMNGDADLFLNYGKENLPSPQKFDWKSSRIGHQYIMINLEDDFFKRSNNKTLEGYYTLLITCYSDTSYILYISAHKNLVLPLQDNSPMNCICEMKGQKCHFRYDDIYSYDETIQNNQIIFTNQYYYGDGKLYAKISNEMELNKADQEDNLLKIFPDSKNNDASTEKSKQRNYFKINVQNDKYNVDSIILLTFECDEPTEVEINTASLNYDNSYDTLDETRENIYYLRYNKNNPKELLLSFLNLEKKTLMYTVHSYIGKGNIEIFTNESSYDYLTDKLKNKIEKFDNFDVDSNDELNAPETYSNYLQSSNKIYNTAIFFKIKPYSDFGFFIKLHYEDKWEKIIIGKQYDYLLLNDKMIGYFDIYDEYESIEFSLSIENMQVLEAIVYIKINQLQRSSNENENNNYNVPTESNYDYKDNTDPYLGTLSINIENLPKINEDENKFIRGLFLIEIKKLRNWEDNYYDDDYDNDNKKDKSNKQLNTKISILVSPQEQKIQRNFLEQMQTYYTEQKIKYDNKGNIIDQGEKIFNLERKEDIDDLMVIEISSCSGEYTFRLSSTYEFELEDIHYEENDENGKKIITIENLKNKHVYLSIEPIETNEECEENKGRTCTINFSYMMYYYTTTLEDYEQSIIYDNITYSSINNGIKITIPTISKLDFNGEIREFKTYKFDAFITTDENELKKMQSICYLSKLFEENEEQRTFKNFKLDKNNSYFIKDINLNQTYYLNILARNHRTGEIIAFRPIILEKKSFFSSLGFPSFKTLIYLLVLCIILYICYNYLGEFVMNICSKFGNKQRDNYNSSYNRNYNEGYQRPGFSNEGYQRPGMNIEMPSMKLGFSDKIKYTNLSDN